MKLRMPKRSSAAAAHSAEAADLNDLAPSQVPLINAAPVFSLATSVSHDLYSSDDDYAQLSEEVHLADSDAQTRAFSQHGRAASCIRHACSVMAFILRKARRRYKTSFNRCFRASSSPSKAASAPTTLQPHPYASLLANSAAGRSAQAASRRWLFRRHLFSRTEFLKRAVPHQRIRLCLYLTLSFFVMIMAADFFMGAAFSFLELNMDFELYPLPPALLSDGTVLPWLDCDCTGEKSLLANFGSGGEPESRMLISTQLNSLHDDILDVVDPSCSLCASATSVAARLSTKHADTLTLTLPSRAVASAPQARSLVGYLYFLPVQFIRSMLRLLWCTVSAFASTFFPNTVALAKITTLLYTTHADAVQARLLQDRQNRGVEKHRVAPMSPWTFFAAFLKATLAGEEEGNEQLEPKFFVTQVDTRNAQRACEERAPLPRTGLPRGALPWLSITAAAFRPHAAWMAEPNHYSRNSTHLLPLSVSHSKVVNATILKEWLTSGGLHYDGSRPAAAAVTMQPEVSVAISSPLGENGYRSYFCGDLTNVTRIHVDYFMDPAHKAVVEAAISGLHAAPDMITPTKSGGDSTRNTKEMAQNNRQAAKGQGEVKADCKGCTVHCVHPRLVRRAVQHHLDQTPTSTRNEIRTDEAYEEEDNRLGNGAISWDVALEDVDAGLVRVFGGDRPIIVTRSDLFICKLLYPNEYTTRDGRNSALLLSTDVWLSHFGGALPVFYLDHTSPDGVLERDSNFSSLPIRAPTRLMPLHTAAVYGEALQSFPDYALRQAHWTQFDHVYLPHRVRRPQLLRSRTKQSAAPSATPATNTRFSTWTVSHLYLLEFQLIVFLNQQLRRVQRSDSTRQSLHAEDLMGVVTATSGVVPRLAMELLHGADPLLLPIVGENLKTPAPGGEGWRPPSYKEWSSKGGAGTELQLPFSSQGRIPAIAAVISHCWHGRLWWLSELSRYYPVHNFGRCRIPTPSALPGDVDASTAAAAADNSNKNDVSVRIPQRAHYPFPLECSAKRILEHHRTGLALASDRRQQKASVPLPATLGKPRRLSHLARDHELRCVFRKYRYVLSFENSIEDDYVTEKVYNGLLSGALPLYVGAMNIDAYVPRTMRTRTRKVAAEGVNVNRGFDGNGGTNATTSSTPAVPFDLPILPILQLFPILNETAARLEDRRVLEMHEADEAMSSHVLRTHASILRDRAVRARVVMNKLSQVRQQQPEQQLDALPTHEVEKTTFAKREMHAKTAEVLAGALAAVAQQSSRNASISHFLLYSDPLSTVLSAPKNALAGPPNHNATSALKSGAEASYYHDVPVGSWPAASVAPTHDGVTEGQRSAEHERVEFGLSKLLGRVHADLSSVFAAASTEEKKAKEVKTVQTSRVTAPIVKPRSRGRTPKTNLRAVRVRDDRGIALTLNTAYGFAEEVGLLPSEGHPTKQGDGAATKTTTTGLHQASPAPQRRIEAFADDALILGDKRDTYGSNQSLRCSRGGIFSKHFVRRPLPYSAPYEATLKRADGPPMNGFAQLAAYLRALDADPILVEQAGFFDWWKAESMEDFGATFLAKLYTPHPICSICAAALERKNERGRQAD